MTDRLKLALLAMALPALGCSSSPDDGDEGPGGAAEGCVSGTGYPGDQNCIEAPSAEAGFQIHYGPADHDDPEEMAPYLLPPGEEEVKCYALKTPNTEDVLSTGYQFHMRPGSHHLIVDTQDQPVADGPLACGAVAVAPGGLGGTQVQLTDSDDEVSPENAGLAIEIAAKTQVALNFHVVNTTDATLLSEAWLNYEYAEPTEVTGLRGAVFLAGGLGFRIDPRVKKTYEFSCSPTKPARILSLAAHMHAHARRMTAWRVTAGVRTKILESFNWEEPGTVYFDEAHQNPPSDAATGETGADLSGELVLQPSDVVEWECEVENTSDATLTFRNEAITGEMCVVTGAQVDADDPTVRSDFTCVRN